jgi:hypothetical protein
MSGDDRDSDSGHDSQSPGQSAATGSGQDIALIHGVTPEGDLRILRRRKDRIELGGVRALREGVPITGEVVRLTPRAEFPLLCDVVTEMPAPPAVSDVAASSPRKGPAQVATDSYRDNWDRIFSSKPTKNLTN